MTKGHLSLVRPAVLLCPVLVCLWGAPAEAQIYALRDESGVLTLSDKPLGEGAQAYAVSGAAGFRTHRALERRTDRRAAVAVG